jgi:hypothetical protein
MFQGGSESESDEDVVRDLPSPSGTNRRKPNDSIKQNRNNHINDHKKRDTKSSSIKRAASQE